ncbi:MAG TPA: hypothetical protein VIK91_20340, partial [Nannocystis sp.]
HTSRGHRGPARSPWPIDLEAGSHSVKMALKHCFAAAGAGAPADTRAGEIKPCHLNVDQGLRPRWHLG